MGDIIIAGSDTGSLALPAPDSRPDQAPPLVYLASLAPGSRRVTGCAMNTIAHLLGIEVYRDKRTGESVLPVDAITNSGRRSPRVEDVSYLYVNWPALRFQHAILLRSELAESYSLATVNRFLSALRGVVGAAFDLGQMSAEDYQRVVRIKSIAGTTIPPGRSLTPGELYSLIEACILDDSRMGVRDAALVAVIIGCGLRRAEAAGLNLTDYNRADGSLIVRGKGRKERIAYPQNGANRNLDDWLAVRGGVNGPLFCRAVRGGAMTDERLTPQGIYAILNERLKQAGIEGITPHDLRRTFITRLLELGADIGTVQKLAGHSNVNTTLRYDRRDESEKQKAAHLLHIPYIKRG
ncbi:MAG: integrase [Peptococcaceae bacterium]|nr:MAG: integrase [Peptococcaceae bacterium]